MKKKCICCGEEKEIIEFCKNKNSKDGYHYYCRQCNSHNAKKWRMKNPDKTKEYNEKHSDIKRKWVENNLERIRSKQKERKNIFIKDSIMTFYIDTKFSLDLLYIMLYIGISPMQIIPKWLEWLVAHIMI